MPDDKTQGNVNTPAQPAKPEQPEQLDEQPQPESGGTGRSAGSARASTPSAAIRQMKRPARAQPAWARSTRVRTALDMVENGTNLVPIVHAGGCKSPAMVLRYTQQIDLAKSGIMQNPSCERLAGIAAPRICVEKERARNRS
jgi:hypothetical protein